MEERLRIGIRQLKAELSRHIGRVEQGIRIFVTRRSDVAAVMMPPQDFDRFEELERREALLRVLLLGHGLDVESMSQESLLQELHRRLSASAHSEV